MSLFIVVFQTMSLNPLEDCETNVYNLGVQLEFFSEKKLNISEFSHIVKTSVFLSNLCSVPRCLGGESLWAGAQCKMYLLWVTVKHSFKNHNFIGHLSHSVKVPNTIATKTSRFKSQLY